MRNKDSKTPNKSRKTKHSTNHKNLWEDHATPPPQDPKDDPYGHIAFYRAIEMM